MKFQFDELFNALREDYVPCRICVIRSRPHWLAVKFGLRSQLFDAECMLFVKK